MTPEIDEAEKARLFLLYKLSPLAPGEVATGPELCIHIIRHGEKPLAGDNLSHMGLARALALPDVLNKLMPLPPDYTYVPCIGTDKEDTTRVRMMQTVLPYAVQHNLTINSDFAPDEIKPLVKQLRRQRGTALLVWEHHNIVNIAAALKIEEPQEWPSDDFDSIWTITFSGRSPKGKAKFPVLTKSRQHINP